MKSPADLSKLRHSAAHLLAHAITELYPRTKLTIGPATAEGFFYDFLPVKNFKEEDLPKIEAKMQEIAARNLPIVHREIPKEKARTLFKDNPFKLELIDAIEGDKVGLATQGDFIDLCKGGHVEHTGQLTHTKLLTISGSYWRADRQKQPLQRISGTAFFTKKELRADEKRRQEALQYDHRKLGKELDLFSFHQEGPGFPFYHPKGKIILNLLSNFLRTKLEKMGYQEISTPIMLRDELWQRSGHYDHYREHMYLSEIDDRLFVIKPMNCPGAILLYKERPRSYRDLPLRFAEFGLVHRYELSGVLHGLFRTRAFTIDDAHIFCTAAQLEKEVAQLVHMTIDILKTFGFNTISVGISTKPKNAIGDNALWQKATDTLIKTLKEADIPYQIFEGEGAFYGPKVDFIIQDSMGREWQCATAQIDFFQPENFDLWYINAAGKKERPVIIHRAIYGSLERFFGILLEHYKGKLPFWLAPVQIKILTITDQQRPYAQTVYETLKERGYRVALDESSDPISGKIKEAQKQKIPWMLVIGPQEVDNQTVTLRYRQGNQEPHISIDQLIEKAQKEGK